MYVYIYIYIMHICMYVCIYIYIYIERERERDGSLVKCGRSSNCNSCSDGKTCKGDNFKESVDHSADYNVIQQMVASRY